MLKLVLDDRKTREILTAQGFSYEALAEKICIEYEPTERLVREWRRGNVSVRWRKAVGELTGISPANFVPTKAKTNAKTIKQFTDEQLMAVRVLDNGITRAAIGSWIDGGGIDIERLIAVSKILNVNPHRLLSDDTINLLTVLSSDEKDATPEEVRSAMF